jgi:CubicO group peptidase (beta-lactamase class C family)
MPMFKILLIYLLLSSINSQTIEQKLDSLMIRHISKEKAGAALMIVKDNMIFYKKGFGLANSEAKEFITEKTNFRMASVSKQFTAMCIMILVKEKKLLYDENLLKFFPNWNKKIASNIQIRHLLTHSSGVIDYESLIPENQTSQILDEDVIIYWQI